MWVLRSMSEVIDVSVTPWVVTMRSGFSNCIVAVAWYMGVSRDW